MKLYDNVLGKNTFGIIKNELPNIPWYFTSTAWNNYTEKEFGLYDYSFAHMIYDETGNNNSYLNGLFQPIVISMLESIGEDFERIIRLRLAIQLPLENNYVNFPHVDAEFDHKSAILYLNDSDGDTILYEQKYDSATKVDSLEYVNKFLGGGKKLKEEHRIQPQENKLVLFDGLKYHSSSKPTKHEKRIILNINYI